MKLLYEVEIPGLEKPSVQDHPDPDGVVRDIAQSVERAFSQVSLAFFDMGTYPNRLHVAELVARPLHPQARWIGVGVD